MASKAKTFVGENMTAVTPYLYVENAADAVAFYEQVMGAEARFKMTGKGGVVMHAEMVVNGAVFMMGEANAEMSMPSPKSIGGSGSGIFVYVPDVDATYETALKAGATPVRPLEDMFWGDRTGCVLDPFGHNWTFATHVEDVTPAEMEQRQKAWMKDAGV